MLFLSLSDNIIINFKFNDINIIPYMALTIWFLAFLALQNYNFSIVFANFQCLDELADETFEVEESNFFMESLKNGDFGDPNDPEIKQLMCDLSDQERMLESAAPMPPATIHPIFDVTEEYLEE